jgi:hypothetical protein
MKSQSEISNQKEEELQQNKDSIKDILNKLDKIKKNINTVQVKYPEYKEAYDYVDSLFPRSKVKEVILYFANGDYLEYLGFVGLNGFICILTNEVVVAKDVVVPENYVGGVVGKITKDEAAVHELLHYCYSKERNSSDLKELNEEFAYGYSLGYLKNKGYTNEEIISNMLLPYLSNQAASRAFKEVLSQDMFYETFLELKEWKQDEWFGKNHSKIIAKQIELAILDGEELITIYTKKLANHEPIYKENTFNRFDMMDIID